MEVFIHMETISGDFTPEGNYTQQAASENQEQKSVKQSFTAFAVICTFLSGFMAATLVGRISAGFNNIVVPNWYKDQIRQSVATKFELTGMNSDEMHLSATHEKQLEKCPSGTLVLTKNGGIFQILDGSEKGRNLKYVKVLRLENIGGGYIEAKTSWKDWDTALARMEIQDIVTPSQNDQNRYNFYNELSRLFASGKSYTGP